MADARRRAEAAMEAAYRADRECSWGQLLDAIPTDVLARYVVERRLREHAERLADDPEIQARVDELERRLAAGEPLADIAGPSISIDEFRHQHLTGSEHRRTDPSCPFCTEEVSGDA